MAVIGVVVDTDQTFKPLSVLPLTDDANTPPVHAPEGILPTVAFSKFSKNKVVELDEDPDKLVELPEHIFTSAPALTEVGNDFIFEATAIVLEIAFVEVQVILPAAPCAAPVVVLT